MLEPFRITQKTPRRESYDNSVHKNAFSKKNFPNQSLSVNALTLTRC